ncbi:MAG: glycine zipper 2TM domain-containing protein [Pseudomonadota bacterium]
MTHTVSAIQAPSKLFAGAIVAMSLAVAGCQTGSSANTVRPGDVGYAITVKPGVVTSTRAVTIKPDRSIIGTATGAVLGGIAGSELGGGDKANTAGAIGGAVLGGIAGNMIGSAAGTQQGVAITVQFDDGNVKAFIQPADANIQPGQPVNVEFRPDGAYVVPIQYAPAY